MQKKVVWKLLLLGGLSILMLVGLRAVGGITSERESRLKQVQGDIAKSYAGVQRIAGPVFQIEFRESWMARVYNRDKDRWYSQAMNRTATALVYPERLQLDASLQVQERYRGIFKANVFQSSGSIRGAVRFPEAATFRTQKKSSIEITGAKASLMISDARGISRVSPLVWNGEPLDVRPGSALKGYGSGVHVDLPAEPALFGRQSEFQMDLGCHGMGRFEIVPIGSENRIRLESPWPHPSFVGDFLATDRQVSKNGFTAEWNVNSLACSAQRDLSAGQFGKVQHLGVGLIDPVNPYPLTDRALKYGFLFIFITFAAFFLFESLKQLRIHPIQYSFVGLAQAIFFLLLLSLSEHIGFSIAYLLASGATIAVISLYLCSVLGGVRRGALFGGVLALLYASLYGLLQSEDHALVAGSALLFGLTALVMMLTRKIDWYALATTSPPALPAGGGGKP